MKKKKPKATTKKLGYTQLRDPKTNYPLSCFTHGGHYTATPEGLPSEVVIYGQHYKIYYHTHIYAEPRKAQRLRGIVMYPFRAIYIDPRQTVHDMRETLYHEVGHVYLKTWQTKSEGLSKLKYNQVEDSCDMFAEAVYDLVSNNLLQVG